MTHSFPTRRSSDLNVLGVKGPDDVSGKLVALTVGEEGSWTSSPVALEPNMTVHLLDTASEADLAFATVEGMLNPPALYAVTSGSMPRVVQALPPTFDARQFTVEQRFATSRAGPRIPSFPVRKKAGEGPVPPL